MTQQTTQGGSGTSTVTPAPTQLTNEDWAVEVLQDANVPVTQNNITFMLQWMASENHIPTWWNRNNPLNNSLDTTSVDGLGTYPNLTVAAQEVAINLNSKDHGYPAVIAALQASAPPSVTAAAIQQSDWAGSHYGYGASWHSTAVPIVASDVLTSIDSVTAGFTTPSGAPANPTEGQMYTDPTTGIQYDYQSGVWTPVDLGADAEGNISIPGLSGLSGLESGADTILSSITSKAFWTRIGLGILGIAFIIVALALIIGQSKSVDAAVETAAVA